MTSIALIWLRTRSLACSRTFARPPFSEFATLLMISVAALERATILWCAGSFGSYSGIGHTSNGRL